MNTSNRAAKTLLAEAAPANCTGGNPKHDYTARRPRAQYPDAGPGQSFVGRRSDGARFVRLIGWSRNRSRYNPVAEDARRGVRQ